MIEKRAKIYIAGHQGMVGSAVTRKFIKEGYANLLLKTREDLDLFNQKNVQDFFLTEKPEYVILAAARVGGIKANMECSADFLLENLLIQNNVIGVALQHDVKKFLFLGSSCIYPRECPQPMKEEYLLTGPLEPTNEGYAIAKVAGLKLCEKIYEQYTKTFISCMPTNIYGENDNFDPETSHALPALLRRIHEAKMNNDLSVTIWGTGNSRREWLYVDDLADALYWLMQEYDQKQFLNIGTGVDHSMRELAEIIAKVVGYEGTFKYDTTKPDGMPQKLLDVSKLHAAGWKHNITIEEGIRKAYDWFLERVVKLEG